MKITKPAFAGTLESSDVQVRISPNEFDELNIELNSAVKEQFGEMILSVVKEELAKMDITSADVVLEDKGALDCVIRARLQAAILRSTQPENINWEQLS